MTKFNWMPISDAFKYNRGAIPSKVHVHTPGMSNIQLGLNLSCTPGNFRFSELGVWVTSGLFCGAFRVQKTLCEAGTVNWALL